MFELRVNNKKNAVFSIVKGRLDAAEAKEYTVRYAKCVDTMQPGFILLVDVTEFVPTTSEVRDILHRGTEYALKNGLGRVVRIVSDSLNSSVGNIQLNRTSRELGYQVDVVQSMEEAEKLLGWK